MNRQRKHLCIALLLALLLCVLPATAFASANTTLTTTVPAEYPLRIEISGKGSVAVNGVEYVDSTETGIPRNTEVLYKLVPAVGYKVGTAAYNGVDITGKMVQGNFTALADGPGALNVSFVPIAAQLPQTGDANNVSTAILAAVLSLAAVIAVAIFIAKNKE